NQSDTVVTSACKGLAQSVQVSLGNFYDNGKPIGGALVLGAADDAVGLPVDTWSLQNWTVDEYNALFEKIKSGEIKIDNNDEMADPSQAGLEHITFEN
ncbi:MAG: hypothetical protein IKD97_01175, partial [Firmicutes bacterium]|nr:hypothetical protein [Bacillota bacterium]